VTKKTKKTPQAKTPRTASEPPSAWSMVDVNRSLNQAYDAELSHSRTGQAAILHLCDAVAQLTCLVQEHILQSKRPR